MKPSDLGRLPEPCSSCTFWESSPADLAAPADHTDRHQVKADWAEAVSRRWGYCGVVALSDDELIGHLTVAPSRLVPRLGAFAHARISPDAAVLVSVHVVEEFRGSGVGRQLVQAAAALVARRDIRALEALGTYHDGPSCMLPVGWLEAVGFATVRPHPVTPRLRMDLQTTLRWSGLGAAWNRLTGLVGAAPASEPATYTPREASRLTNA